MNNETVLNVELDAYDWRVIFDLLGQSQEIEISDGVRLRLESSYARKGAATPDTFNLVLAFAGTVAVDLLVNLAASWLYDKLKDRKKEIPRLVIERTEVEVEEGQIKRVLCEKLKLYSRDDNDE